MTAFRDYVATFITNSDMVDVVMVVCVVVVVSVLLKVFGFGLYDRK